MTYMEVLTGNKTVKLFDDLLQDLYESPEVIVYEMSTEGVICASGTHDSLTEDDEWMDYM